MGNTFKKLLARIWPVRGLKKKVEAQQEEICLLKEALKEAQVQKEALEKRIAQLQATQLVPSREKKVVVPPIESIERLQALKVLVERLGISFINNEEKTIKKILNCLLEKSDIYNEQFTPGYINKILCISFFYGYDQAFQKRFASVKVFLKTETEANKLYQLMHNERSLQLHDIVKPCVGGYIANRPDILGFSQKEKVVLVKRIEAFFKPYYAHICVRKEIDTTCKGTKSVLKEREAFIRQRSGKGYVLCLVYFCEKCKLPFMKEEDFIEVNKWLIANHRSGLEENKNHLHAHTIPLKNMQPMTNRSVGYNGSINSQEDINSQGHINTQGRSNYEGNLSSESIIKSLGYDVRKSRDERWRILQMVIIPKLGREKVIKHLSFLVRLNKSKKQMEHAVYEWEYDIRRLL